VDQVVHADDLPGHLRIPIGDGAGGQGDHLFPQAPQFEQLFLEALPVVLVGLPGHPGNAPSPRRPTPPSVARPAADPAVGSIIPPGLPGYQDGPPPTAPRGCPPWGSGSELARLCALAKGCRRNWAAARRTGTTQRPPPGEEATPGRGGIASGGGSEA